MKNLHLFAFWIMYYLQMKAVKLAYHVDPQGNAHLAVIAHNPNKQLQFGSFLYPGSQYDIVELLPETMTDRFTIIDAEDLWKKVNFGETVDSHSQMLAAIEKAIERLH